MRTHHVRRWLGSSQLFRLQTGPHRLFLRILQGKITPADTEAMQPLATSLFVPQKTHQSNGQPGNVAQQRQNLPATVLKPKEDKVWFITYNKAYIWKLVCFFYGLMSFILGQTLVQSVQNPVQVKKNKKKARTDVKPVQHVSTNDWREPDEGKTWPPAVQIL